MTRIPGLSRAHAYLRSSRLSGRRRGEDHDRARDAVKLAVGRTRTWISDSSGVFDETIVSWGNAVGVGDLNGDGKPDIVHDDGEAVSVLVINL
ncbi:hypothetical protein BE17_11390 [Sorangium cellulosum]|uniref:VCBS repeat-containing protein n=1 Tax=Sorangium cellulosum TaxID=56 RepID=A0A150SF98_SORCE|nr:hypothetical protein BE17_11390 [Sorangium cellulosum]